MQLNSHITFQANENIVNVPFTLYCDKMLTPKWDIELQFTNGNFGQKNSNILENSPTIYPPPKNTPRARPPTWQQISFPIIASFLIIFNIGFRVVIYRREKEL
jgi:hypothetical protein